jgi:glutamate racemase
VVIAKEADRPIGMFDSGVGGLTVARAVIDSLPQEDLIYFGDTARCPYGPRSPEEIRRFALEIIDVLVAEGIKLLVVACNSAASAVLVEAQERYDIPIVSVIEPAARAAVAATRNRRIGVIGTQATIASGAYPDAVARTLANVELFGQACPRFVEFVEKGDTGSDEVTRVAQEYLQPLKDAGVDTLILGCTHYPLLSSVIHYVMGDDVVLISSAEATAADVYAKLRDDDLLRAVGTHGKHRFLASSERGMFGELSRLLLGPAFSEPEYRPWAVNDPSELPV